MPAQVPDKGLDQRFQALLLASASIVWWTNAAGEFVEEQPYWEAYTGQTWEEYRGSRWISSIHPDDREALKADWDRAVASGAPYFTQGRIWSAKHKGYRAFQTRAIAIRKEDSIEQWLGALTDVQDTIDLQRQVQARRDIETRFHVLADNIPTLCWMARSDGWIFWYNRRWYEYTGTTPESQEGWGWQSVHDPNALPAVNERWKASIDTGQPFEMVFPLRGADGVFRPFLTRIVPHRDDAGQILYWFGTNTNVDDLKRAEEALRESEQRLRLATEAAKIGTFDWNIQTGVNAWSPELEATYGLAPGEFDKTEPAWVQLIHPDDRAEALARNEETLATGQPVEHEWRVVWRDGTVHWIMGRFQGFKDATGKPLRVTGVNIDITAHKQAETALRESNERLEGLIRSTTDAVITIDEDQRIVLFNPAAEQMFACPAADATGSPIDRFIPATLREAHRDHVRKFATTRVTSRRMGALGTLSAVRANGDEFPIEAAISQVTVSGRTLYTAIVRDITERKQAEEAQRLMVGELQHRTRNMLTVVQAIIANTMRESKTLAEAKLILSGRVQALSNAYSLLMDAAWEGASLDKILSGHSILESNRVTVDGCEILLKPRAAQQFAMIVHELATNALKYGALSSPDDGRISISGKIVKADGSGSFIFSWKESGGPRVSPPTRKGFGSVILLDAAHQFGTPTMDYLPDGLLYQLELDLKEIEVPNNVVHLSNHPTLIRAD